MLVRTTLLAALCMLPARSTWGQAIHTMDGILTLEERNAATDSLVEAGAAVFIQVDTSWLRITVHADSIGVASLCLGSTERVLVLHSSAALGMLEYRRADSTWSTDASFSWAMRDTAMDTTALQARHDHLRDEGWVASTYQMGQTGDTEFLVRRDLLPAGDLYLALGIMPMPRPDAIIALPSNDAGDCARGDLVRGPAPLTGLHFNPRSWKRISQHPRILGADTNEADMEQQVYTHALWRVKPGNEAAFIEAWTALGDVFSNLDPPPLWGTLLRSATEPNVFYSFGPWPSTAAVEKMRSNDVAQAALSELIQLCEEASPGMYHVVKHVKVP